MARPRQPPQEPQPQPPPAALPPGQVADRLGMATGAAAAAAAAAPPAAGAVAGVVAPAAVAAASKKIVEGFVRFFKQRRRDEAIFLFTALREGYPQRTVREIDDLVSREMQREAEFYRRAQERLERDLPKALSIPNREKRAEAVTRLLERERRYVKQREQAAVERSAYRAEMIDVKKASPLGAFWKLDPTVQQHTLDCLLMGEKFWPWEVLDDYHPQLHPGCMCHLLTHREAVERGYISEDFQPDVKDAIASARSIIERVGRAQESAWPSEIEAFLYELLLEAKVGHRVGYDEETEQIKKRAERPEAKARHEFKPAIWTHRNGHPRCRVCGDEEPVGGICNGKPTREEAQAWADKQAREGWGGWYVADDGSLKLDLQEAAVWAERLHPRDRSGRWRDVAWQRYRMIGQRENVHHAEVSDVEQEVLGEMIARLPERARTRVKYSDIRGEQHVHSNYSDGHNSIRHIAEQALKHGHQHVVISDHAHHLTPETVRKQHEEIDRLNREYAGRLKIVKGIEANIDEQGNVTGPAGVSLDQFEHVNAGLHHDKHAHAHERLMKALDDPRVHALAHPHTSDNVHYGELAKKAAEKGVALELNARDVLRNERDPHAARMVRAAIRHGARLQITSDSHQADSDFTDTRHAVELARRNGVKAHHLYHYGDRRLQEASWDERWPKGDVRGGQFRPRRGGIRRSVRRSLRGLVKELPQIATQAHPQGRYVWLRGRHVFVPRGRTFHRRIDGVSFHSPAGSTNIYRDGKLVQIEGQAPPPHHADLDVPLVPDPRLLSDTAKYDPGVKGGGEWPWMENLTPEQAETALAAMQVGEQERERLNEKLGVALETMPEESPINVGDSMPEVGDLLEVHGFIPSSSEQTWENGDHVRKWKHAQSGAYLSILWNDRTAKVRDVTWIPGRKDWATPEPPINHRPQSWDEFTDEIRGVAYRLAHDNNDTPVVGEVRYVESIGDHSGFHHSKTGLIELGAEVPAVIRLSERRRAGQMASPEERRSAYRGYKVAVHEAIHGAGNVIPALVYARPEGKGIEEALTEELAHIETVNLLRAHGANEVLEWMRQHPNDYGVVGTYHTFRQAMDEMMNRAKIAPELREDYLRDLKWNVPPNERVAKIARDLVDAGAEPDFKDANTYVLSRFTTAKKEEEFGVSYFAPILRPDLTDYPAADGVIWNDTRIREGSIVSFKLGGEEHDGVVQQVEQANQPGTKFKLNVRTADQKLHRHVLDSMVMDVMPGLPREENQQEIEMNPTIEVLGQHVGVGARIRMKSGPHMKVEGEVALVDPDNNLRVWIHPTREQDPTYDDYVYEQGSYIDVKPDEIGAVLQASDPPTVIKLGSLIHYDGRADNGISEARVTNLVDLGVHRYAPAHIPRHAIEAVTTENSLSPGKLVYLTPDRMNGVSVVAEERGLAPVAQLPVSTPRPEPLAVAADLPEPPARGVPEPAPYVDLKTVPIQTAAGPLTFYEHHGDAIGPEYHQDLVATNADGINVGYVSVAFLGDTAAIKMIEVAPEFRRKGVASALIQHIRREHPGVNIETLGDVATPEGQAFVASGRRSSNVVYDDAKLDVPASPRTGQRFDAVMYHGTTRESARSIMQGGLRPAEGTDDIWLTTSESNARSYAVGRNAGLGSIVTANVRLTNPLVIDRRGDRRGDRRERDLWEMLREEGVQVEDGDPAWGDRIREQGHDGIVYLRDTETDVEVFGTHADQVSVTDAAKAGGTDYARQDEVMRMLGALDVNPLQRDRPDLWSPHPRSGFMVRNDRPRTTLIEGEGAVGKPPRVHDTVPGPLGINEVEVLGSVRPPRYVFRAISEEDYQQSLARGYLQSDQRMNLADEGTVAAVNDPTFYLPGKLNSAEPGEHVGRVVRIEYRDEDGWLLDRDGYVKTPQRIPVERVDAAPQFVTTKELGRNDAVTLSTRPTGVGMPDAKGDPGEPRVPLDQVVYIAEGAMDRGGLNGGVVTTIIGHPHHPTEEGRAESARLTAMAREITGDPSVVVHVSNDPVWGGGANVIAAYDWVFNKVSIRPGATKLDFLHELAHVKTKTPEGPGGHTTDFVRVLRDLYRDHISPEAADQFWSIAGFDMVARPTDAKGDAPVEMERSWHLTDTPNFAFDPERVGQVNSTLGGEMDEPGIFVTKQPEFWFNRHDYVRPFIAEIEHPAGLGSGYYDSQDNYLPASLYARSRIVRVIPVDEYVREHFHEPGWIEEFHGDVPEEFKVPRTADMLGDRYRLPEDYRYTGPDVRDMSPEEQQRHFDRVRDYIEQSDRRFSMLRKYDDRGEIAPDFEKWVWPHEMDDAKGDPGGEMLLWHGTPRADDVRADGLIFTEDAVGHGGGPAIWLTDSLEYAEGYGEPVRVAASFRKPLFVRHERDSDRAADFEEALKREGVDVSKYPRLARGPLASPAVVARAEGFDAVAVRYPDMIYGPEVPEHLRVSPGHTVVTAFDLGSLRVIPDADTGRKGGGGEPQVRVPPSRFLTVPKSGKLREPALGALAAVDGLISVPTMHGPIPLRATAGKNTRGGFLRRAPDDTPKPPEWEGPTVRMSGFGKGRGIVPAKRAAEVEVGDELLFSGGYRMPVTQARTEKREIGFGRPPQTQVFLTLDRGEDWGDSRFREQTFKPDALLGFNWKPPADQMPPTPDMAPHEIRVSVQPSDRVWATEATVVHELAHYMDNQAFDPEFARATGHRAFATDHVGFRSLSDESRNETLAKARERGGVIGQLYEHYDATESPLVEWYEAVAATPEYNALTSASMMEIGTHKYLLSPRELWARSFAQWVALRSGDPALKEWLFASQTLPEKRMVMRKNFRNELVPFEETIPPSERQRQWQHANFIPVAEAMDRLFDGLGWRHGAETGGRGDGDTDSVERRDAGARPGGGDAAEFSVAADLRSADTGRKGGGAADTAGLTDPFPGFRDAMLRAVEERPERLTHGYTGHNAFFVVDGRVYVWDDYNSIPVDARIRAIPVHSHSPDGVTPNAGDDYFDQPHDKQPLNSGDMHIWMSEMKKGRMGPHQVMLYADGTADVVSLTENTNPKVFSYGAKRWKDALGVPKRDTFRAWLADNGFDYHEQVRWATPEQAAHLRSLHPSESIRRTGRSADAKGDVPTGGAHWWPHPIPVDPPKLKLLGSGVYESEDGRITMYRLEGVRPYAWNVEWTTDYENAVRDHGAVGYQMDSPLYSNLVDGAGSKKDALAIFRDEWEETRAKIVEFETALRESAVEPPEVTPPGGEDGVEGTDGMRPDGPVQLLLEAVHVPEHERGDVIAKLLLLDDEERVGFVDGWLLEADSDLSVASILGS